jgi:hypothetical protein
VANYPTDCATEAALRCFPFCPIVHAPPDRGTILITLEVGSKLECYVIRFQLLKNTNMAIQETLANPVTASPGRNMKNSVHG